MPGIVGPGSALAVTITNAGAIDDTVCRAFGVEPANGMLGLDTTNHRLYIREAGTWKYTGLT